VDSPQHHAQVLPLRRPAEQISRRNPLCFEKLNYLLLLSSVRVLQKKLKNKIFEKKQKTKFALFSMDLLGKKSQLPAAELSDDEMDALSGLTKINPTGKQGSFNPYKTINPEFLTTALEQDDDDWMYMGVSHFTIGTSRLT
jgi:hypothetical protein